MQENFSFVQESSLISEKPANIEDSNLTWHTVLKEEKEKEYFKNLLQWINAEYVSGKTIYPPKSNIFNAIKLTEFSKVKVVILGQDPYHNPHQAHGLSFSVQDGISIPPSLQNIFKEIQNDIGIPKPQGGNLEAWASQGVLLLNSVLTVEKNKPASHAGKGWETFTDKIIEELAAKRKNLVFILWGSYAKKKVTKIDTTSHLILTSAHPSPFSAQNGFFDQNHFSKTNKYLEEVVKTEPIDWKIY